MLHSCYLIDMNRWKSGRIQFWPRINAYDEQLRWWPKDDIIYFSGMARLMDIDLHVGHEGVFVVETVLSSGIAIM